MSDPTANLTLEISCKVGSFDNALEAIEDGADVNYKGGAPLFLAIMNRDRKVLNMLLDHGADASFYLPKKKQSLLDSREELIEELIACAPSDPRDVKLDQIEEIDTAIRSQGVEYLLSDLEWDGATRFRDTLNAIGAGSSHRCVAEFLHWARTEHGIQREGFDQFLVENHTTVSEYRERYLETGEDLVALANEYLSDEG